MMRLIIRNRFTLMRSALGVVGCMFCMMLNDQM